jgi:predicted metalloprotease with PDZ domain
VREFSRHVQEVSATDDAGHPLPVSRPDKRTVRVPAGGGPVTLRYRVYAHELTVRTSHVDASHAYFNPATVFMTDERLRDRPHHVEVHAPAGWSTFVALDQEGEVFVARDYDTLLDSPFEVGPHTPHRFTVGGVPHELVLWGEPRPDVEQLARDLARVCEAPARLFGGLPMRRYLWLVYLVDRGRGGLEHRDSSVLLFPRFNLSSGRGWEDFLRLAAHEYFHLWNAKRVQPRPLVRPDLGREVYTTLLWAFEGGTSYYDTLLVRRAGLMSPSRFLVRLGEAISQLHATPGRRVQTLAEASLLAWIKHYRPDESSPNSAISYYLKGEVVCALLDLHVRQATGDRRSLDEVMRLLWQRYGDGRGVPEDGVERAASEVAGVDLSAFFERAVRSTEELDYGVFSHVGLEVRFRARDGASDRGGTPARGKEAELAQRGWLGLTVRGHATVATVLDGSPAMEAGIDADDEVVALDGFRVDGSTLLARCEERRAGDAVRVALFRRDRLLELPVTLGKKPLDAAWLARMERPTEAQRAAWEAWLGARWEDGAD